MRIPRARPVLPRLPPGDPIFGLLNASGPEPEHPIHPRPGFEFPLRDGRLVFLSPVLAGDGERLAAAFELLSERSRHFRFFRTAAHLSDAEIRYLTEVDQVDHVAWCALDAPDPPFDGLGSGRLIRDLGDPGSAEVAVTVLDASQRLGLGTTLLGILVLRAEALGVDRLRAFVLPENQVVCRWLTDLGWSAEGDESVLEFTTRLDRPAVPWRATPARARFDRVLTDLRGPLERCLEPGDEQDMPEASPEESGGA